MGMEHIVEIMFDKNNPDKNKRWKNPKMASMKASVKEGVDIVKIKNHIEHLKDLIRQAPAEDKVKLREILKGEQAALKRAQGGKIEESVEDADHHLQLAHDSLGSAILKAKRSGKDVSKLEKLRAELTNHLKSLSSKD
jgi:t-SNARE complex subunit (syntaxin)